MGFIFCHNVCDGLGAAQFLNAVGELARGLEKPTTEPVWHRNFFPSSQTLQETALPPTPPAPPQMPEYKLENATIDMPVDQINRLKREFQQVTGLNCSSFEIVAAACWTSRTRAIQFEPNTELKLVFFANCRRLFEPDLPKGYYGNCFFPMTITASCESVRNAAMVGVVKLIQEAKAKLGVEFNKYLKGEHLNRGEDPFAPPLTYTNLFISEWGRLGFNQVDYQWGPPVHVVPVQGSSIMVGGIVGLMPLPNKGFRLTTWCVEEAHRLPFLHEMHGVMNQELSM